MRSRTQAKRDAILGEASKAFIELGYERTSMAAISARVGGSKATLYRYFASKEQLFVAVARSAGEEHLRSAYDELAQSPAGDEDASLRRFGESLVGYLCLPEAVAIQRMVMAESGHTPIGTLFFEAGPKIGHDVLAGFLGRAMAGGRLRHADPVAATEHLLALLSAEIMPRRLLGLAVDVSRANVVRVVERAVAAFLAAYAA